MLNSKFSAEINATDLINIIEPIKKKKKKFDTWRNNKYKEEREAKGWIVDIKNDLK